MKKSRYTDRRIIAILKQAEAGTPVPELCREHGMSSASPSHHGYECRLPRCTRRRDKNFLSLLFYSLFYGCSCIVAPHRVRD